jgi:DEAD/DEAH box helicase domain-containing protein
VFGSHLANVLRRLRRVCAHYGSNPVFICCSATIANPGELAAKLVEDEVVVVDENGAPSGEKHVLFYNPPVVNRQLGLRRSAMLASRDLASTFLANNLQTIVFGKSRLTVELLLSYVRQDLAQRKRSPELVQGYRGGYLPLERRAIERGLRSRELVGVVATNALELGIDIGGLQASVLCGYPGTIASAWQQMGRVGRRDEASVAVMVANSSPLDQFLVHHPDYFFGRTPESGLVNPDNLVIVANHLKCAAFERPFDPDESFGPATQPLLEFLEQEGVLHRSGRRWHWMDESYPAEAISLRSASVDNFVIIDQGPPAQVIGEMDRPSVPTLLHEEAIYLHLGQQYQVERLDWHEKKAYVRKVDVDYYTDANLAVSLRVLDVLEQRPDETPRSFRGEVSLTWLATIFKKIKLQTHENVGWGKIHLPEEAMHTTAYWLSLPSHASNGFTRDELQAALSGLAHLLEGLAPMYVMGDPRDLGVVHETRSPFTDEPTIYVYERVPAGVGFAEKLFTMRRALLEAAADAAERCACERGCPSCVGPVLEAHLNPKALSRRMLSRLLDAATV